MAKIDQKQQKIIKSLLGGGILSSSKIHEEITRMGEDISLVTVKRVLLIIMGLQILLYTISVFIVSFYIPKVTTEKNLFMLIFEL